ncbi:hypothetical protein BDD12DRAFT_919844 [Trichophaea hybrida]|nr:hypothetical protein BDD12DRAFT_919844 [Trichophaea hybrida]
MGTQDDKGYLQEAGMVASDLISHSLRSFRILQCNRNVANEFVLSCWEDENFSGYRDRNFSWYQGRCSNIVDLHILDDKLISYDYISDSGAGKGWLDGYGTLLSFIATDAVPNLTAISTANDTKTIYLTGQREFIWAVNWRNETGWQKKTTDIQSSGSGGLAVTRLPGDEDDHVFYTPSDGGISKLHFNWVTGKATVSNFDIS